MMGVSMLGGLRIEEVVGLAFLILTTTYGKQGKAGWRRGAAFWILFLAAASKFFCLVHHSPLEILDLPSPLIFFLGAMVIGLNQKGIAQKNYKEFPLFVGFACLGFEMALHAKSLLGIFLALELGAIGQILLVSAGAQNKRDIRTAVSYFILSAMASALFLYGMVLLQTSIRIEGLDQSLSNYGDISILCTYAQGKEAFLGGSCLLLSLCFKLALFPLHFWVPAVYQASSLPVIVFLSSIPKLAVASLLFTLLPLFDPIILGSIGGMSIFVGAFGALSQTNIFRFLAYSGVTHLGIFSLAAAGNLHKEGMTYLIVYVLIVVGLLASLSTLRLSSEQEERGVVLLKDLKGLIEKELRWASLIGLLIFTLMGLPPLGGFFIKVNVLAGLIEGEYIAIVFMVLVGAVISAAAYLKVVKAIFVADPMTSIRTVANLPALCLAVVSGGVALCMGFFYLS